MFIHYNLSSYKPDTVEETPIQKLYHKLAVSPMYSMIMVYLHVKLYVDVCAWQKKAIFTYAPFICVWSSVRDLEHVYSMISNVQHIK